MGTRKANIRFARSTPASAAPRTTSIAWMRSAGATATGSLDGRGGSGGGGGGGIQLIAVADVRPPIGARELLGGHHGLLRVRDHARRAAAETVFRHAAADADAKLESRRNLARARGDRLHD